MSKKALIGIVILIVLAGGWYLSQKSSSTTLQNLLIGAGKEQIFDVSFTDLMTGERQVACTFSTTDGDIAMEGTVYAGAGRVREDYRTKAAGQDVQGHMIANKSAAYVWSDMGDQGVKFDIRSGNALPAPGGNTPDLSKKIKFTCKDWAGDPSVFDLPSNITFR